MSLPARYQELWNNGMSAHNEGRLQESALLFEQAHRLARQHDTPDLAFNAGLWAAEGWEMVGHPLRALELLTNLLADVPPNAPHLDVYRGRVRAFHLSLFWTPSWKPLERRLDELEQMVAADSQLPPSDVPILRGRVLFFRGQWSLALEHLELAWSVHDPLGFKKYAIAQYAALSNLHLGDRSAAGRWCQLLGQTDVDFPIGRFAFFSTQTELDLWDCLMDEADTHSVDVEDQAAVIQRPDCRQRAITMRVRSLLVRPFCGDPAALQHPARHLLQARVMGKLYVHFRHERLLLLADYRLACIRYAAGMPPADDLWYQHPQTLPDRLPADPADFQQRVFHARRAYGRAMRYSQHLDECFQCDWRQKEIQDRQSRLEAIVTAVNSV